ncbi:lysophospholipase catalytic domain-containing protein [Gautieria morchelliformis]|nr:lysophospholipase catalytic domain-containing protein [Gautieria morchelliformis]
MPVISLDSITQLGFIVNSRPKAKVHILYDMTLQSASRIRTCAPSHTISKTLEEQGISLGPLHVIAALQVLHATTTLAHRMSSISDLLVPGGYVLTVDFDGNAWHTSSPGTLWYDFIIGCFQEWFDYGEDRTKHCTISLGQWGRLLREGGFNCVTFSCIHRTEDHSLMFLVPKANANHHILPPPMINGRVFSLYPNSLALSQNCGVLMRALSSPLLLALLPALAVSQSSPSAPLPDPTQILCPNVPLIHSACLPAQQSLSPGESSYISSRTDNVLPEAWKAYLGNVNAASSPPLPRYVAEIFTCPSEGLPKLGIATSGGGYHAAFFGAASLTSLDGRHTTSITKGTDGLLQATTYLTGLSGGSWLTLALSQANFPTFPNLIFSPPPATSPTDQNATFGGFIPQFDITASGPTAQDTLAYIEVKQLSSGLPITITDPWSRGLARHFVNGTTPQNVLGNGTHSAGILLSGLTSLIQTPDDIQLLGMLSLLARIVTLPNSSLSMVMLLRHPLLARSVTPPNSLLSNISHASICNIEVSLHNGAAHVVDLAVPWPNSHYQSLPAQAASDHPPPGVLDVEVVKGFNIFNFTIAIAIIFNPYVNPVCWGVLHRVRLLAAVEAHVLLPLHRGDAEAHAQGDDLRWGGRTEHVQQGGGSHGAQGHTRERARREGVGGGAAM